MTVSSSCRLTKCPWLSVDTSKGRDAMPQLAAMPRLDSAAKKAEEILNFAKHVVIHTGEIEPA